MNKVALVIAFDEPEENVLEAIEELLNKIQPIFTVEDLKTTTVWVGIREAAEAVLTITGEVPIDDGEAEVQPAQEESGRS